MAKYGLIKGLNAKIDRITRYGTTFVLHINELKS